MRLRPAHIRTSAKSWAVHVPGDSASTRHCQLDVSNLDENGGILAGDDARWQYRQANELWHTDSSFRQRSATWSLPDTGDCVVPRVRRRLSMAARYGGPPTTVSPRRP